jgi:hypothetical protein
MAGAKASVSPKFKENLPENCPPKGAGIRAYDGIWRYVNSKDVTDQDFASYYALGKRPPPTVPPCRWASSSLFLTKEAAYTFLPKLRGRYKFIAKVNITEKCGVSLLLKSHIDFWRFDTFKPSVVAVEDIPDEDSHG